MSPLRLGILLAICLHALRCVAATHVLLVSGLAGDQGESDRLNDLRGKLAADFVKQGVPEKFVEQLGGSATEATRENILAKLGEWQKNLKAGDEAWLILLGHSSARADAAAFAVRGKRLTTGDLKEALDAVNARQFIIVTTAASGAYATSLHAPNRVVLTATQSEGEENETVFPECLAESLASGAKPFLELARDVSLRVKKHYDEQNLVQTEHALLSDPQSPEPIAEPFDGTGLTSAQWTVQTGGEAAPEEPKPVAEKETPAVEKQLPGSPIQPATDETRAIMKAAAGIRDAAGFATAILKKDVDCLVNADGTQVATTHLQTLIQTEAGARAGNQRFEFTPPFQKLSLTGARTIFPDGTFREAALENRFDNTAGGDFPHGTLALLMPSVSPGCVIEFTLRDEQRARDDTGELYQEIRIAEDAPIAACDFTLRVPKNRAVKTKVKNLPDAPSSETGEYSKISRWKWTQIPALEPLPNDPPLRNIAGAVLISSWASWDEFAAWFHRIAAGSDEIGDAVAQKARAVTANAKDPREKLRALYEFVSAIRYVPIEIGVNAFRPRTPASVLENNYGDCKDKANLLIALARAAGLDGRLVLLNRTSSTDRDFPGFQFNHAIAFFPRIDGGLFLDATDEITPFGFLPPGDVDRDACILTKSGVDFQTIPIPPAQATRWRETLEVDATAARGEFTIEAGGLADYRLRSAMRELTPRQARAFLQGELCRAMPQATLLDFTSSNLQKLSEPVRVRGSFELKWGGIEQLARSGELPFDLAEAVAAPSRKLPLVLNDGQPFVIEQILKLNHIEQRDVPYKMNQNSRAPSGLAVAQIVYDGDENTMSRRIVLDVTRPVISPADYEMFRWMIQNTVMNSVLHAPEIHKPSTH